MTEISKYDELIARYLNGNFSNEDEVLLLQWVNADPKNKKQFLELKDTWDAGYRTKATTNDELLKFYKGQVRSQSNRKVRTWVYAVSAAAILVIGLLLGGLLPSGLPSKGIQQLESFYVPAGSRSELTLADGTKVKLNSDSRLDISPAFSSKNRVVRLVGEAYFEVKSDKKHPFTVETPKFDVLVTGTKFNISSYADDSQISTALYEGSVQLSTINKQVVHLTPGEKVSFDQKTMEPIREKVRIDADLAWVNGEFMFDEIPFSDLIKRLERWYDVSLTYQSSELDSMVYSGSFRNQETIWQVLDALKITSPIDYQKLGVREFELNYRPM